VRVVDLMSVSFQATGTAAGASAGVGALPSRRMKSAMLTAVGTITRPRAIRSSNFSARAANPSAAVEETLPTVIVRRRPWKTNRQEQAAPFF
jgi:hypothetical protein